LFGWYVGTQAVKAVWEPYKMGFWGNFFKSFARSAASGLSTAALDEAARAANAEIDSLDGLNDAERAAMKHGVNLLRERVERFVDSKLDG
jgi:hypothetical protein